jgi:3-oxoacyl-[acyl-carrier protein] reductase
MTANQQGLFSLRGRVALITGAGGGLGRGIALALAQAGATVAVNDIDSNRAQSCADAITAVGGSAVLAVGDCTNADDIDRVFTEIEKSVGGVDIIVFSATAPQRTVPIDEEDWAYHQSMIDSFLKSLLVTTQRALPRMKAQGFGRIINITSEVFETSEPGSSAYVAAKGAQIGWSRSAAKELAEFGITVNTVAPGFIPVERHKDLPQEILDDYLATVPAGRWGTPSEIGWATVYFASDEAAFVSGQTLIVNGGRTPH